jgi:hypothetical protein
MGMVSHDAKKPRLPAVSHPWCRCCMELPVKLQRLGRFGTMLLGGWRSKVKFEEFSK